MAKSNAEEVDKTESNESIVKKITAENVSETGKDAPVDSLIKHPLQNSWTLWYYDNEKGKSWEACQHQITTFDTVEDFWSLYNHIKQPLEIKNGNDYSLFKNNIRPMWEDEQNKNGGRWIINLQKFFRHNELDKLWLEVILCLIGEAFDYSEDICGAVVNVRPSRHKIAIWTSNNNKQRVLGIGRKLKESLNLPQELQIQFELHKESAFKHGSGKAAAYTL